MEGTILELHDLIGSDFDQIHNPFSKITEVGITSSDLLWVSYDGRLSGRTSLCYNDSSLMLVADKKVFIYKNVFYYCFYISITKDFGYLKLKPL